MGSRAESTMLETLQVDDEVRKILAWPFDFDLSVPAADVGWFAVKPVAETKAIACDGTGGIFLLYGPQTKMIHISSEGQAGVIAGNLEEGIRIIVTYPYWRDLLKFSGGGKLKEMRRVVPFLEREMHDDHPGIDQQRAFLREKLYLADTSDPIESLHRAVSELGNGIILAAPDGTEFRSLFNTFTVDSNPTWWQGVKLSRGHGSLRHGFDDG